MHGQFLWFSAESDRNFLSKNFLSFLNFARYCIREYSEYSTYGEFSRWKFFFFTQKKNSIRFQTNFTDYKYFLPMILSIDRKIKKKIKKRGRQYIHHQRAENESQNLLYLRSRGPSIFLHSTPPRPLIRNTNNFSSSVFPCILFYSTVPPSSSSRKSVFRPLTFP